MRELPDAQLVVEGLSSRSVVDETLLLSDGPVTVLGLDEAVVFVNGDVTITGDVLDSIVVSTGALTVTGTVKGALILSRGEVRTESYVKASLFEARFLRASGNSKACFYVGTTKQVRRSHDDRSLERVRERPLDLFRGR